MNLNIIFHRRRKNTYVEVASPDFMTNSFRILINRQRYDRIKGLVT